MKVKNNWIKEIIIVAAVGFVAYAIYQMYQAYQNGKTAIEDMLTAPFTALWKLMIEAYNGVVNSSVGQGVQAVAALPGLEATEQANANAQQVTAAGYQPGGSMYQLIAQTQGQAAADNAANQAAANAATESSQAAADQGTIWYDPFSW